MARKTTATTNLLSIFIWWPGMKASATNCVISTNGVFLDDFGTQFNSYKPQLKDSHCPCPGRPHSRAQKSPAFAPLLRVITGNLSKFSGAIYFVYISLRVDATTVGISCDDPSRSLRRCSRKCKLHKEGLDVRKHMGFDTRMKKGTYCIIKCKRSAKETSQKIVQ